MEEVKLYVSNGRLYAKSSDYVYQVATVGNWPENSIMTTGGLNKVNNTYDADLSAELAELIDESLHFGRSGFEIAEVILAQYKVNRA